MRPTYLVVDDQRAVREGVARLIRANAGGRLEVLVAATPAEVLDAVRRRVLAIVVLDVDLAGEDGLALIPQLAPSTHVIVLSSHGDRHTRSRALALGAKAFVEKHEPASTLLRHLALLGKL